MKKGFLVAIILIAVLTCALAFAACAEVSTTVTYMVDGEVFKNIVVTGTGQRDPGFTPSKSGYTFDGWYTDEALYTPFDFEAYAANEERGNLVVYAKFTLIETPDDPDDPETPDEPQGETYTVTFYVDGDASVFEPREFESGKAMGELPAPEKNGYRFVTWKDIFGEEYNSRTIMPDNDLTLYASWQKIATTYEDDYVSFKPASEGKKHDSDYYVGYSGVQEYLFVELTSDDIGGEGAVGDSDNFDLTQNMEMEFSVKEGYTLLWYEGSWNNPNGAQMFTLDYGSNIQLLTVSEGQRVVKRYLVDIYVLHDYYVSLYEDIYDDEPYTRVRVIENEFFPVQTDVREHADFEYKERVYYNSSEREYLPYVYSEPVTKNISLYQTYEPKEIELILDEEGEVTETAQLTPYSEHSELSVPEKEGYDFIGWQAGSDEDTYYFADITGNSQKNYLNAEENFDSLTAVFAPKKFYQYIDEERNLHVEPLIPVVFYTDNSQREISDIGYALEGETVAVPTSLPAINRGEVGEKVFSGWNYYRESNSSMYSDDFVFSTHEIDSPTAVYAGMTSAASSDPSRLWYGISLGDARTFSSDMTVIGATFRMYLPVEATYTLKVRGNVDFTVSAYMDQNAASYSANGGEVEVPLYWDWGDSTGSGGGWVSFSVTERSGSMTVTLSGPSGINLSEHVVLDEENSADFGEEMIVFAPEEENDEVFTGWQEEDEVTITPEEMTITLENVESAVYTPQFHDVFVVTEDTISSEGELTAEDLGATATDADGTALDIGFEFYAMTETGDIIASSGGSASVQISGTTVREYDFTALADGSVTIYTESSLDTYGELYYNGSSVASDDDDGEGNNFSITYSVTEGRTYTIKVRGYNSNYNGTATLFVDGNISSSDLTLTDEEREFGKSLIEAEDIPAHAGEEITVRLLAQNEAGRTFNTDVLVKVYAMPEITFAHDYYYIVEGEDFETLFTVTDSFDETLEKTITTTDDGEYYAVTVTATDAAGNTATMECEAIKVSAGGSLVILTVDGVVVGRQAVSFSEEFSLPGAADEDIAAAMNGFSGWLYNGSYITGSDGVGLEAWNLESGAYVLNASGSIRSYSVYYDLDGGSNASENPSYYTVVTLGGADGVIALEDPSKSALRQTVSESELSVNFYVFDGWYKENTFENEVTELSLHTGEITVYAKWIERTVTLNVSDEAGGELSFTAQDGSSHTVTASENSSHVFLGWFNGEELLSEEASLVFTAPETDVTYVAQYHQVFEWTEESISSERELTAEDLGATATDADGTALDIGFEFYAMTETGDIIASSGGSASVQISGTTVREYDFTALADGSVTIYTESSLDTYGELYYNGSSVASDDDDGEGNNFSITYSVTEGRTYTIKVRGYSSSYNGTATLFVEGNISSSDLTLTGGEIEEYLSAHAGEEITIRLLAQNEAGRTFNTDVLVKVYAMPEITFAHDYYYIVEGEDFETLFTVTDSFDETLEKTITTTDDGEYYAVTVTATDAAGNTATMECEAIKVSAGGSLVILTVDGVVVGRQAVSFGEEFSLPGASDEVIAAATENFAGWEYEGDLITANDGAGLAAWNLESGVYTLTANATVRTYSVTYVLDGGINNSANPSSYSVVTLGGADGVIPLEDPTKYTIFSVNADGTFTCHAYKFLGWYKDSGFEQRVSELSLALGSVTLYAKWAADMSTEVSVNYVRVNENNELDEDGGYILFGQYPQTIKAADVSITSNTPDTDGYYLGSDGERYAKVVANPDSSGYTFSDNSSVTSGNTYYFNVEPIRWRILSESDGNAFILCDSIIANHYYHHTSSSTTIDGQKVYANNYKYSDIRAWLNDEFYNTAFGDLQQALIQTTEVDNSAQSTDSSSNPYACENTFDKVFLPSSREVITIEYGFESSPTFDTARQMITSDFSRATGAYMSTNSSYYGNGWWWLRSPYYDHSNYARSVNYNGGADYRGDVGSANHGVVPALNLTLS